MAESVVNLLADFEGQRQKFTLPADWDDLEAFLACLDVDVQPALSDPGGPFTAQVAYMIDKVSREESRYRSLELAVDDRRKLVIHFPTG